MVNVDYGNHFLKVFEKIKDAALKSRVKKQIEKIVDNPEVGKPMMHSRKGTREVYVSPYRLSYSYLRDEDKVLFLDLYHKDVQ